MTYELKITKGAVVATLFLTDLCLNLENDANSTIDLNGFSLPLDDALDFDKADLKATLKEDGVHYKGIFKDLKKVLDEINQYIYF